MTDNTYDAQKDLSGSLNECYRVIRKRKAAGGDGWNPKRDCLLSVNDGRANSDNAQLWGSIKAQSRSERCEG